MVVYKRLFFLLYEHTHIDIHARTRIDFSSFLKRNLQQVDQSSRRPNLS